MRKIILILSILIFNISLLFLLCDFHHFASAQHEGHQMASEEAPKTKEMAPKKILYHCPMHPSYISDRPGDCPICGMKLVLIEEEETREETTEEETTGVTGYASVKITAEKQQLIGVTTTAARRESLTKTIHTVGRIAFDPELYKAEEEFIQAVKSYNQLKESPLPDTKETALSLVESSKLRLRLMGLSEKQIQELENETQADTNLLIAQSENKIWLYVTIYEADLDLVKAGQSIEAQAVAYPGEVFKGEITALDSVFDPQTRSLKARALIDNPEGKLKPDMYADVEIKINLGEHLVIPETAVLDSGLRQIVFVDIGNGYFKPQQVKLGQRNDDMVIVLEGLQENDSIVTSGNFLIDSESKLKAAIGGAAHQHGQ